MLSLYFTFRLLICYSKCYLSCNHNMMKLFVLSASSSVVLVKCGGSIVVRRAIISSYLKLHVYKSSPLAFIFTLFVQRHGRPLGGDLGDLGDLHSSRAGVSIGVAGWLSCGWKEIFSRRATYSLSAQPSRDSICVLRWPLISAISIEP